MSTPSLICYHCGLPVTTGQKFRATVFNEVRPMCCLGCQSVTEAIVANGLEDYYKYRTEMPKAGQELVPEALQRLDAYDYPDVQKSFVKSESGNIREASLILEGITCAACVWLNERHLRQLNGVRKVSINYSTQRVLISWDETAIRLSQILAAICKLGYNAYPFSSQKQEALRLTQRRTDSKRLAVAGLCAAQVMMLAIALYAGPKQGMEYATSQLLRWLSLVLSIPVMSYAAWPFYKSAWRGLLNRTVVMDLPISLGLLVGFAGSLWGTVHGRGHVYFDTVTMLVFFLLGSRFLERNARYKSVEAAENLLRLTPSLATLVQDGTQRIVPVAELSVGDVILVKPGETIVADGMILEGVSSVDESLLTGESRPISKASGEKVLAGSVNYESPLHVELTAVSEDTILASISRLLERAQAEKPRLGRLADQMASWFTLVLLLIVVTVGLVWIQIDSSRVLEILLSLLVVSCPCALSLAAPAALAAATSNLIKHGVLLTRSHALETLASATHILFDKTGTLTYGKLKLVRIIPLTNRDERDCIRIAASLEQHSEHPVARSILQAATGIQPDAAEDVKNTPGKGMSGRLDGTLYRIGNQPVDSLSHPVDIHEGETVVWLSDEASDLAVFVFQDSLRPQAKAMVEGLRNCNIQIGLLSGDSEQAVRHVAQEIGIPEWEANMTPERKLKVIQSLQSQGAVVAVVGDGINDAPFLAGANVSIAMGNGTQMALTSGDAVLMSEDLKEILRAVQISRSGIRVIRQNFLWALIYNLVALPFAATGSLSPLLAAIGMSASSLIVVINATRLSISDD